jgi:hypothetical protein
VQYRVWFWYTEVGYCSSITCSAACGGWVDLTECGLPSTCAAGDRRYFGGCCAGDDLSGVQCTPVREVTTEFSGGLLLSWEREVCGCGRRSF